MDSVASRIIKARQYVIERDQRIQLNSFEVQFDGEHNDHTINYDRGTWKCTCEEFQMRSVCAHIMAMEEILGDSVETAVLQLQQ